VSLKADIKQLLVYVESLPKGFLDEGLWSSRGETLKAIRDRMVRDDSAQAAFLTHFQDSTDLDVISSVARLAGLTFRDKRALKLWAEKHIEQVRLSNRIQPTAYDMLSGRFRAVELCLLESCLTN
jgi:hypothetical protein